MATIIDELMIKLGIDGKSASAGANQVKASMDGIAKTAQGLMKTFAGVGMALTGAFAAGQFFSDWKTKAVEFQNIARSVGKSMEEVQAYAGALGKYGGSVESFTSAFRSLNGELIKISTTGTSRAGKILGELGIDVGEVGRMRDADAVLGDIADVMSKMSMAEATGLGAKIGFDASFVQLLHEGRDGFKDIIEQKKRDAIYTEEDAQTVREYNAAQKQLSIGFARIANVIFRTIVPAFTYITRVIGDFVKEMSKHQVAIKAFIIMLGTLITAYLMPSILRFFASLLTNPITWVILALAGLAIMIEDLIVWANEGKSAFPGLWEAIFDSPEDAKQLFADIQKDLADFVTFMQTDGKEIAQPFIDLAKWLGSLALNNLLDIVNLIKAINAGNFGEILAAGWKVFIENVYSTLRILMNLIGVIVQALADEAVGALKHFMGLIKEQVDDGVKWIQDKIKSLGDIDFSLPVINFADFGLPSLDFDLSFVDDAKNKLIGMIPVDIIQSKLSDIKNFFFATNSENEENTNKTISNINNFVGESGALITGVFSEVFGFLNNGLATLQNLASNVTSAISSFFADLGSNIKNAIGDAIDWALEKLASLASAIANTPIIGGAISLGMSAYDAVTGGGNTSNSTVETKINSITVNTQATDANGIARDIAPATQNAFNYQQAQGGAY